MISMLEIVPALYRPHWQELQLSANVTTVSANVTTGSQAGHAEGMSKSRFRLLLGGSGRYRMERLSEPDDADEVSVRISDGQVGWEICGEVARQYDAASLPVPFADCLNPAWLLADFDLEITGSVVVDGREGTSVLARRRATSKSRTIMIPMPDSAAAVVDDELGFLLRCEQARPREFTYLTEFTALTAGAPAQASSGLFGPPAGQTTAETRQSGERAVRTEGPAAIGHPVSDDDINLLHRTMLAPQEFSADLHEWADNEGIWRAVQDAAGRGNAGRYGSLMRLLAMHETGISEQTARVHIAMPGKYRIDQAAGTPSSPASVICDGQDQWRVYADRVARGSAQPRFAGIALIIDPAWMLRGYRLSSLGTDEVAGRRGPRIRAVPGRDVSELWHSPLSLNNFLADYTEAVIDTDLGISLQQTWYHEDQPILVTDFSNIIAGVDPAAFHVDIPSGTRLLINPSPFSEFGPSPGKLALDLASRAAKGLLSRFGGRPKY